MATRTFNVPRRKSPSEPLTFTHQVKCPSVPSPLLLEPLALPYVQVLALREDSIGGASYTSPTFLMGTRGARPSGIGLRLRRAMPLGGEAVLFRMTPRP